MKWCCNCAKNTETRDYFSGECCADCVESTFADICNWDSIEEVPEIWCSYCGLNCDTYHQDTTHYLCCVNCGEVVNKKLGIVLKGEDRIKLLKDYYGIKYVYRDADYFSIAVECGFTRGREVLQVAAACLYLACREMEKPLLLIEFSRFVDCNVYRLGIVYLQLCQLFGLQDHPVVQNPVDPNFFMHRYTSELMKDDNNKEVSETALHLVVYMKREWILKGLKPSGMCAAAIYVSSMLHGYNFSKKNVVEAVQKCDETLSKRLIEFENTESASLTIEELTKHAMDNNMGLPWTPKMPKKEVVCEHKSSEGFQSCIGIVDINLGLCVDCYLEFCDVSQPSAFQPGEIILEKINVSKEFAAQLVASKPVKAKRKRELEAKHATLASCQHFKKKLSSKINYDAWTSLFGDEEWSPKNNVNDGRAKGIGNEIGSDDDGDGDWNYDIE